MENSFNEKYRIRTKTFAIRLCKMTDTFPNKDSIRILKRQLIRSGTSIAANFYAASRARSRAEYYAKMCIVVEECDETAFWLSFFKECFDFQGELLGLEKEATELLSVFAKTKQTLKPK